MSWRKYTPHDLNKNINHIVIRFKLVVKLITLNETIVTHRVYMRLNVANFKSREIKRYLNKLEHMNTLQINHVISNIAHIIVISF